MVRRTTSPPPIAVAEQALPATASGAVAGAVSDRVVTLGRLRTLLAVVARQEPRLRWSVGQRDDGSTLLVTDLAGGWIPPHVDLPDAVQVLDPRRRHGDTTTLLGAATAAADYRPGQHVAPTDRDEPVPTSQRPRYGPAVAELGWELRRATRWRDGLPRLAHTLVHAVYAQTGVLANEFALLRAHLEQTRAAVLADYPDKVSMAGVGNWQLLAAIAALIAEDRRLAMYHYAWFRACCAEVRS